MLALAEAIKNPDEIWVRLEWHLSSQKSSMHCCYIARLVIEGEDAPLLVAFDRGKDGWGGVPPLSKAAHKLKDDWRVGLLLYRRAD